MRPENKLWLVLIIKMSDDAQLIIEYISKLESKIEELESKLDKLTSVSDTTTDRMTLEELKQYIHTRPSESTIRRWMKDGMPYSRLGKRLVFSKEKVDNWMKSREDISQFAAQSVARPIAPWRAKCRG